tara:strand:+ start:839 stop:1312 length:474 start_codon:yes stop_codon:yes gene_type:complete
MLLILFGVFLVVPIVELYLIIEVTHQVGFFNTLLALIIISVIGAWMVKQEGLGIVRKVQAEVSSGRIPEKQIIDGLLILFAAVLMLTPGFATDAIGLFLLFPPTRIILRSFMSRRLTKKLKTGRNIFWGFQSNSSNQIVDVDWHESDDLKKQELEDN